MNEHKCYNVVISRLNVYFFLLSIHATATSTASSTASASTRKETPIHTDMAPPRLVNRL